MKKDRTEYLRRYAAAHREERLAYYKRYYLQHRDAIDRSHEAYREQPRGDTYAWIKAARKQAGVTQQRLAKAVGCSPAHISMLERGKADASAEMQERIAHALTYLLGGGKEWR